MSRAPRKTANKIVDEPPPLLGSWRRIYVLVLIYLAIVIFSFYIFTRAFAS